MKMTLSTDQAISMLLQDQYAAWTYAGARALVEYLNDLDDQFGTETEFDRVAIRCDFSEWESLGEWAEDYFADIAQFVDESNLGEVPDGFRWQDYDQQIRAYIEDNGTLIEFDGGIIVSSF